MKLEVNQIVFYQNQPVRVVRAAPVRFGEKRVVIQPRSGRRRAVKVSLLTLRAVDETVRICSRCGTTNTKDFQDCYQCGNRLATNA